MNKLRALLLLTASAAPVLAQGITITTPSPLPTGVFGIPYSITFSATGGTPPYFWIAGNAPLPQGLSIDSQTGELSGTPSQTGTFVFTVDVFTGSNGSSASGSKTFTLKINNRIFIENEVDFQGQVGVPFSATLTATGGENNGPYIWALVTGSSLPAGLTLNPATGAITGTPTGPPGSFSFIVTARDTATPPQTSSPTQLSIEILPAVLAITTSSPLPAGVRTIPYALNLAATGGVPPYSWSLAAGSLPPGLTLTAGGALTGVPAQPGVFSFTIRVIDSGGNRSPQTATRAFSLQVFEPLQITTTSPLPAGRQGEPYSQTLQASGGATPYTWSLTGGSLPPGLTLSPAGLISGTPTTSGAFSFTARVQDSAPSAPQIASRSFDVQINRPTLIITTASPLNPGTAGTLLSQQFSATGGGGTYTWSISSGALPPGITLNPATGIASGTPTTAGTYTFAVRVVDAFQAEATKPFTIVIQPPALVITTSSTLPAGEPGAPYVLTFAATGTPPYTWSVAGGTLPPGLNLSSAGVLTGEISQGGQFSFVVRVRDASNQTTTKDFTIVVVAPKTPLEIGTTSLPDGTVGVFYGATVFARGGTPPYGFSISGLPPGVDSNSGGGIFGTPTRSGQYTVRVSASDNDRGQASATFTITIRSAPVEITTDAVPEGRLGTAYSATFSARGGVPPYAWSLGGGTPPPGLSLSAGGELAGTPTQRGTFTFSVQASDTERQSATKSFTLIVRVAPLAITTDTLPNGTVDSPYSGSLTATGGITPYKWSLSGSVPPGLTVNGETGDISGTPTIAGTFTLSAQVSDSDGQNSTKAFTITIAPPLVITTTSPLPSITVGTPGGASFAATGGTPPYVWSISSGTIPPGMNFSAGQLTGTPTSTGTFSFSVQVTDANRASTSKSFTLAVISSLTITTETLPGATVGTAYSASLSAAGGLPPYRWSASGSLPPGVSVDESGGIAGTPTAPGTFNFTVQVRDSGQPDAATASRTLTIVVALPQLSSVNITGVPDNPAPAQQPRISLNIGSPFPVEVSGTVTLTFTPNAANNADDPAIQFSTGGRTAAFTIPAGQTQAVFRVSDLMIQTGTVAGTITITTALTAGGSPVTCACPLVRTLQVPRTVPVISSVRVSRSANGFSLVITGFSSTREITRGVFRFSGTSALQTNEVIVPLTDVFNTYYRGNSQVGGQFVVTMPFVIQGEAGAVTSVSIILSNAQGDSQPSTASL